MATIVECFGLHVQGGTVVGRRVEAVLDGHPDVIAAEAVGLRGDRLDGTTILHSTSWRWDGERGDLVLTYLCAPDPEMGERAAGMLVIARKDPREAADDPARPSPAHVSFGAVLDHGVGHLAWLAAHQPGLVEASRAAAPGLWDAILPARRTRAGQVHEPHQVTMTSAGAGESSHVARGRPLLADPR